MNDVSQKITRESLSDHPLLGPDAAQRGDCITTTLSLNSDAMAYLGDHCVYQSAVMPAAAFLELGVIAVRAVTGSDASAIRDVFIEQPLVLSKNQAINVSIAVTTTANGEFAFKISSTPEASSSADTALTHASGIVSKTTPQAMDDRLDIASIKSSCDQAPVADLYAACRDRGIDYGDRFKSLTQLYRGKNESSAELRAPAPLSKHAEGYLCHPVLTDACFHVLWDALPDSVAGKTFLPVAIEKIVWPSANLAIDRPLWATARLRDAQSTGFSADLGLFDESGQAVLSMQGVYVGQTSKERLSEPVAEARKIAIAANFNADPIEEFLTGWSDALEQPVALTFADYNQIFQNLLDPSSVFSQTAGGVNAIFVNLEEWNNAQAGLTPVVTETEKSNLLPSGSGYRLPNRVDVAHLNQYETEYLYKELFIDKVYTKHGIEINDGDCVIDIGANIGLFTLFVQQLNPSGKVYSFEPAPHAYDKLKTNSTLYCPNAQIFNVGLSDDNSTAAFTFYPTSSVFSSFSADTGSDEKAIRAVILNVLEKDPSLSADERNALADVFMQDRLNGETYEAEIRTLSNIIDEYGIDKIDLVKLDAEKSELPVLQGIRAEHWPMIKQLVIEVHDQVGDVLAEVKQMLTDHGFDYIIDEEELLENSGLYNIYARRPGTATTAQAAQPAENAAQPIADAIDELGDALRASVARNRVAHMVCVCPPSPKSLADSDAKQLYDRMEGKLLDDLRDIDNVHVVSSADTANLYPVTDYFNEQSNTFGHIPYTNDYFAALSGALVRRIEAINRRPYKVIALDCDNTLWGGVCGEVGADGVDLGAPYLALQKFVIQQIENGMIVCLCSKNEEADVWAVFDNRPEMLLNRDQIVAAKINWQSKSANMMELAAELNLGLDSFVFLDDNPIECAEVSSALPQVLALQIPEQPNDIELFLEHIWAFDKIGATKEDKKRTVLYKQNVEREKSRTQSLSFADFIASLKIDIDIEPLSESSIPRASQLTHRTNQFNFTTRRRSEAEVRDFIAQPENNGFTVKVSDRFGDYGVVGLVFYTIENDTVVADTLLLSCRALGRGVEHAMVRELGAIAQANDKASVVIPFSKTDKNTPALNFIDSIIKDHKVVQNGDWHNHYLPVSDAASLAFSPTDGENVEDANLVETEESTGLALSSDRSIIANKIAREFTSASRLVAHLHAKMKKASRPEIAQAFVAAQGDTETSLVAIWSDVLGLEQVGVNDNFFDLGGKSLLMVKVHAKIKNDLQIELSPVDLFKYPTIAMLAARISESPAGNQKHTAEENEKRDARVLKKREARARRRANRESVSR